MSPVSTHDTHPRSLSSPIAWPDVLAWLSFAVAVMVMAANHELGHDEAQAWNIARAAATPWEVIANGRVEGHTPFWHLVLWPLTRLGDPQSMQWLTALLGMVFAALLLWDRPFPRPVCLLLLFGYFPLYEYTVVARPYAITLVLCALLAMGLRHRRLSLPTGALLCGLIGFTSAFGAVISLPLMLLTMSVTHTLGLAMPSRPRRPVLLGLAVYITLLSSAVYFVVFPLGATAFEEKVISGGRVAVAHLPDAILTAGFPHLDRLPLGIGAWSRDSVTGALLTLVAGLLVVLAVARRVSNDRSALWIWLCGVLVFTLAVTYSGSRAERHLGHLFLAALTILWAHAALPAGERVDAVSRPSAISSAWTQTLASAVLILVLLYHLLAGVGAGVLDILREQSPWRAIAVYIDKHVERPYELFSDYAYAAGAVHAYLDIEPFDMSCPCRQRFTDWTRLDGVPSPERTLDLLCASATPDTTTLILTTRADWQPDTRVEPIERFEAGYRQRESNDVRLFRLVDTNAFLRSCAKP